MKTVKQDFAKVIAHSQWGEEGIIEEIFRRSPPVHRSCCEFGAADGLFFSNTAFLWKKGWDTLLIESDEDKYSELRVNTCLHGNVTCLHGTVSDVDKFAPCPLDLISIDVDGNEHSLFERMKVRHRVVVIEHNPMIPPHLSIIGDEGVGSSALALVELAERKQYRLLTCTLTNCIFVIGEIFDSFSEYDCSLAANFDDKHVCYTYTDYRGNPFHVGDFPYGLTNVD